MGGLVAAVVASRHPELLRSLILANPTFLSPKVQREIRDSDVATAYSLAKQIQLMPLNQK
jgi:pimeloyl-ACP methyl ester carboxylesterase